MLRRITLFILMITSVGQIIAQQRSGMPINTISSSATGTGTIYYADRNEPPRAIEFNDRTVTASYFLANINQYFNIPSEFTFLETELNTDDLGMQHHLLQQYYKGIPIEGMGYRVHERDGFVTSANGKAVRDLKLDTQVIISEEEAFQLAIKHLNTMDTIFRQGKKLIVSKDFTFAPESFSVVFQFDIDVSLIEQWRISIDVRKGQVINKVSLVNTCNHEGGSPLPYGTATGLTNYYGNKTIRVEKFEGGSSRLVGQTTNGGIIGTYDFRNVNVLSLILFFEYHKVYDFYSSDNTYNTAYHKPAVSVQWAAEQAFEYYFKTHHRNSFDNQGSEIKAYVHVGENLNNAFWTHNLLAFGDGNNNNPLVELDVVAHELTHGVTQYEAALEYYNESGALNESFSDIFGKAIEFSVFGDTATWQMSRRVYDGGLRDLSNPNLKNQPDTYHGDMWYEGYEDNGGVHYNSGVQNFWFYLLCEGGTGVNDHQLSYSVNSIGMNAAVKIAYRNLTEYLNSASDYLDGRIGSLLAAADLYGKNSTIYQEVANAWDAVGVIDEPIITNLELYDITATTVKIKGSFLPRGNVPTYHFEYGTTPDFETSSPSQEYTGTVEGHITGLQSETKYYLRLVATNENGSSYFATEFTTISLDPLVKIKQTVDVTKSTATLYGEINPNSLLTSFHFEYGLTPELELKTPIYLLSDTTEFVDVSALVTDLQPRQTYYYRLVATNDFSSSETGSVNFFTAAKPVILSFTPITASIDTEITITGQNFNPVPENNLVSFGATRGTVLALSSTEMRVKVPAGASLGPISLLDVESGLAAQSVAEFVPTFTGEFERTSLQPTMGENDHIYQALVQDMDGDNKPDIVGRHYLGFSVFQNVNQGGDVTNESFVRNTFNSEYTPETFSLVDLDGNGLKDLVGVYQYKLRVYPNFSVPGFVFFGVPVDLPIDNFHSMTLNDFDQDGHIDIATISHLPGDSVMLSIFRNQNPKGFTSPDNFVKQFTMPLPYYASYLYSDDLNNDGYPEFLAGVYDKSFVVILKNNSHPGAFDFDENLAPDPSPDRIPQYVSQDLNQDGWKDIVSHGSNEIADLTILENEGASSNITLSDPVVLLNGYEESEVIPGDINGDGKVDLMVALSDGKFIFLKNNVEASEKLSESSLEIFGEYGGNNTSISNVSSMTINDLNGDGRPEVINTYSFNSFPHDGYAMEIWQNGPRNCLDPSLVQLEISGYTATIILPPNTTIDQFQIQYTPAGQNEWYPVYSTTLSLSSGNAYQLRVRATCYLGFTDYHYIDFAIDCVNISSFSINNIAARTASLSASGLSSFQVQYSPAGQDHWIEVNQNDNQISGLLPGTTYDVRFRGRCNTPVDFTYKQFTTLCPALSALAVTDLLYNKAVVSWTSNYGADAVFAYSVNDADWILIDETLTMFPLMPATTYSLRGALVCTDINSDSTYTSFTTPCPEVSQLSVDAVTPFSARINWVDESNTDSYILTYSTTPVGTVITTETGLNYLNLDNLNPGTEYEVAVAPQCALAKDFNSISFTTICYVPFDLSANSITHTTAELSWNDNFSGVPYFIDYSISGSNNWLTTETASTNTSLSELRPGTAYEARVHINCFSQTAPYASVIFETNLYEETTLAPNPTHGRITIHPSKSLIGRRFSIHDNTGKKILHTELLDYTIDLSDFSPGMYILRIDGEIPMKISRH